MTDRNVAASFTSIPAVDDVLRDSRTEELILRYGRSAVKSAVRSLFDNLRVGLASGNDAAAISRAEIISHIADELRKTSSPSLRPVFNLTGIVLHTNLGRAVLPDVALQAVVTAGRKPCNFEYDLETGRRGDRDVHVEKLITSLTGAEAATVVNNNAAALVLVLNTLATRRQVLVSRGELIEIGGSFRLPEIMASSRCRLREVGTTNRTHLADYENAIGEKTALVMKVHTSNFLIQGFTSSVSSRDLASLCRGRGIPLVVDLGSGTLLDLRQFGLPHEPTVAETLGQGADLVTFSGDKLLGGAQAGIVAGRSDLIRALKRNPLRRALRVDKMTIAALSSVLQLYSDPRRLREQLPTLRLITRPIEAVRATSAAVLDALASQLSNVASVEITQCDSEIGSGALPTEKIPSAGVAIRPSRKRSAGTALQEIAKAFRSLPTPVIGRITDGALILDMRCLEDEQPFLEQLSELRLPGRP